MAHGERGDLLTDGYMSQVCFAFGYFSRVLLSFSAECFDDHQTMQTAFPVHVLYTEIHYLVTE